MLVEFAHPLPVTFHRAFDLAKKKNAATALEDVIRTGSSRILTSGGEERATDALLILTRLVHLAKNRILIMPCGGINSANIVSVVRTTSVREIHTSVGTSHSRSSSNGQRLSRGMGAARSSLDLSPFEKKVVKLVNRLSSISQVSL
jgi:copper homeostasis protein